MEKFLKAGVKAPDFILKDQNGKDVSLEDFKGRKLLIYFYPKADTPGCTTQACSVRDHKDKLNELKLARIGISPDTPLKQKKFTDKYNLNFPLLSDTEHSVAEAYGVWGEKNMFGKKGMGIIRSAFLVNEVGVLEKVWYKISPKDTVPEVLAALEVVAQP